jgi:DNA (cytosine-5)-methyltransferase 1
MTKELSLFTGGGGGLLGSRLLGWQTIGAVEIDDWCCARVGQRRDEGHLGEWFPVWNMDIRKFNRLIAPSYTGVVDVLTAGFPCQPFSAAGARRGPEDLRNMWPATRDAIRIIRPRECLLENVPGLRWKPHGYIGTVLRDLAEIGYDARWTSLAAADVGAPHKRERLWLLCHPNNVREPVGPIYDETSWVSSN